MPTTDEWIACNREALVAARREGDKEREAACLAELKFLGAPEKERAVKAAAPEKRAAKPKAD